MTAWSVILELDTDNPEQVREHILADLRTRGYEVRSKTITTAALRLALVHPSMMAEARTADGSWMVQARLRPANGRTHRSD